MADLNNQSQNENQNNEQNQNSRTGVGSGQTQQYNNYQQNANNSTKKKSKAPIIIVIILIVLLVFGCIFSGIAYFVYNIYKKGSSTYEQTKNLIANQLNELEEDDEIGNKIANTISNKVDEVKNTVSNELKTNNTTNTTNTTNSNNVAEKKSTKPIDKTPVDIKDNKSYYFVIDGKKYNVGDKISSLSQVNLKLSSSAGEKELQKYGYLIGRCSVLDSKNKEVLQITPYNNSESKIKASEAVIGGFNLTKYDYENFSGTIEICNGITIGTSLEDVKAVFGEPTKITEATAYNGPTYVYDAKSNYMEFVFAFSKEGKVERINWSNYNLD